MKKNRIRGPLVTLAAVAALGDGLWWTNVSQETTDAPAATPVARPATTAAPAPPPPPPAAFPARADYVGKIPTAAGTITLDVTVDGPKAVAYACDGYAVEEWLRGGASNGVLALTSKDGRSRLQGRLEGANVVGTLWIGAKKWDFSAAPVEPPAGLYVDQDDGVRNSWIVDADGTVTGVQRRADGSTGPAPELAASAIRVQGDGDVD